MNGQLLRAAAEEIQGPTKFEISTYPIHNRIRFLQTLVSEYLEWPICFLLEGESTNPNHYAMGRIYS